MYHYINFSSVVISELWHFYQKYGIILIEIQLTPDIDVDKVLREMKARYAGENVNTNRDLNYRLYLQREEGFTRMSFNSEFEKYRIISSGNVEKVKENFVQIKKDYHKGKGILSDDPVRNVRYHFIVAVALTSRICVESGMSHDVAYTLSDIYIQRADKCGSVEGIIDMIGEMQVDYAERMREIKKKNAISRHIRKCIDNIAEPVLFLRNLLL